jgi:hypothetical protein
MENLQNDFVSNEKKSYKWSFGKLLASSLSGFIAGVIVASLFFYALFDLAWKANIGLGM